MNLLPIIYVFFSKLIVLSIYSDFIVISEKIYFFLHSLFVITYNLNIFNLFLCKYIFIFKHINSMFWHVLKPRLPCPPWLLVLPQPQPHPAALSRIFTPSAPFAHWLVASFHSLRAWRGVRGGRGFRTCQNILLIYIMYNLSLQAKLFFNYYYR